jgi:hypothetical protein
MDSKSHDWADNMRFWVAPMLIIVMPALIACAPNGRKLTEFGNLRFYGSGTCKIARVQDLPWPDGLIIRFRDGTQLDASMVSSERIGQDFEIKSDFTDHHGRRYVTFSRAGCQIFFENEKFTGAEFYGGVTLVKNGKELKLPASESKIREVFGRPTKVSYLTKPSP